MLELSRNMFRINDATAIKVAVFATVLALHNLSRKRLKNPLFPSTLSFLYYDRAGFICMYIEYARSSLESCVLKNFGFAPNDRSAPYLQIHFSSNTVTMVLARLFFTVVRWLLFVPRNIVFSMTYFFVECTQRENRLTNLQFSELWHMSVYKFLLQHWA